MGADDLNALGILAIVAVAALLVARMGGRPERSWVGIALGGVVIALITAFVSALCVHLCGAGQAFLQWLLPGLCALAVWIAIESPKVRYGAVALCLVSAIALSEQYTALVHTDHYVGNPEWATFGLDPEAAALVRVRPTWHTWLTGLHEVHGKEAARLVSVPYGHDAQPGAD